MRIRTVQIATAAAVTALLGACATPQQTASYPSTPVYTTPAPAPTSTYPNVSLGQPAPAAGQAAPVAVEMGRVADIQTVAMGQTNATNPSARNAVVGGVIGAVVGSVIGKNVNDGHNRSAATVLGGAAGAIAGNRIGQRQENAQAASGAGAPAYRITVQTDQGAMRTYEVGAIGDLRVGDRVRVENGVIYRS